MCRSLIVFGETFGDAKKQKQKQKRKIFVSNRDIFFLRVKCSLSDEIALRCEISEMILSILKRLVGRVVSVKFAAETSRSGGAGGFVVFVGREFTVEFVTDGSRGNV